MRTRLPLALMRLSHDLPEGRRGRVLALMLLLMAVALVWLVIVGPLIGFYSQYASRIALAQQTAERMAHLQEILPHLRQSAAHRPSSAPQLIDGASDTMASATLQDKLAHLASQSGIEISSSETLAPIREGSYQRIGLHITLSAPYPALIRFLTDLAQASPALVVDGLHLHASEDEGRSADALSCDMGVFAYRRDMALPARLAKETAP